MKSKQILRHGSLFSGIGGFDLAAEWMGWKNLFHCEWNPFARSILKYYWNKSKSYEDITKTDFTIFRGRIELLTGGFPCQPYSVAGKRNGKNDDRHLWPEMLRAIREIKPRWVVGENVFGIVNWNGGMVFEEVQVDLENEGYEVQSYILPACSIQAPHQRDRVWFIAYSDNNRSTRRTWSFKGALQKKRLQDWNKIQQSFKSGSIRKSFAYAYIERRRKILHNLQQEQSNGEIFNSFTKPDNWSNFPTQSPLCNGNDGVSSKLDGITFPFWRKQSVKAGGNAIVPQVALQIFKAIELFEQMDSN